MMMTDKRKYPSIKKHLSKVDRFKINERHKMKLIDNILSSANQDSEGDSVEGVKTVDQSFGDL